MFKNDQILMLVVAFLLGYFMRQMFSGVVEGLVCGNVPYGVVSKQKGDALDPEEVECVPGVENCLRPTDSAPGWGCACEGHNCCQDGSHDC